MDVLNFSNLESQVLSQYNKGFRTFEGLLESSGISEKSLYIILEGLLSKNILILNPKTREYEYQSQVNGEIMILDGNILLPTTIIRYPDKVLIGRGAWYQFDDPTFDIRRIIWNVKLDEKTNSTLVDLIKTSILKSKKTSIKQLPEYEHLCNKIVPYSENIGLQINTVGESVTEVNILFKIRLAPDSEIVTEHRGFSVPTLIDTNELMEQLKLPVAERNYPEKIHLNRIYNFSDFIFSKNEIPITLKDGVLTYLKITGIRKGFELTYYTVDVTGSVKKIDIDCFDDNNEAMEKLRDIFNGYPAMILSQNNMNAEMTE